MFFTIRRGDELEWIRWNQMRLLLILLCIELSELTVELYTPLGCFLIYRCLWILSVWESTSFEEIEGQRVYEEDKQKGVEYSDSSLKAGVDEVEERVGEDGEMDDEETDNNEFFISG